MSVSNPNIRDLLASKRPLELIEQEPDEAVEYSAFPAGRVGRRPQMMVCFRKCNGEVEVFAYSMLSRVRSENPDDGFTLCFGNDEVTVRGTHLMRVFHYLCEHRAVEIIEADRAAILAMNGDAVVEAIEFLSCC